MKIKLKSSLSLFMALLLFWFVFSPSFDEDPLTSSTIVVKNSKARKSMYPFSSSPSPKHNNSHKSKKAMEQSLRAKPPSVPNPTQN